MVMLLDHENKVFAIQVCKQSKEHAYKFSKPKGEQNKPISCNSSAIRQIVRNLMLESPADNSYRVKGVYYKDTKSWYSI